MQIFKYFKVTQEIRYFLDYFFISFQKLQVAKSCC